MNIQPVELDKAIVSKSLPTTFTISEKVSDTSQAGKIPVVSENMSSDKSNGDSGQDQEFTKDLIAKIQENIDQLGINLEFSTYGENDERIAVVVKEKVTGKLIREIPSEDIQRLYEKMNELTGLLLNKEV